MRQNSYLIVHKDHPLDVRGINSGAEMATRMLAAFLARRGHNVVVCAQLVDGETELDGVRYWDLGKDFNVSAALERARQLPPYHLISAGRALPLLESRREANCLSRTLISHDRSGNDCGINAAALCAAVDRIICVSRAQRDVFLQGGADPQKLTVVHNGVDLALFPAGDPAQRDYMKLIFVGALVEDKGVHVLVRSFADLQQKYPKLTLDVYGSASLWGREKIFDEQEVERQLPRVKFHGKQPQHVVAQALGRSGICVIPSIWFDPFPLSSLEAQVTGCPVVAFDVGGLKEGIVNGETGLMVQEISQQALTAALDRLLSDPQRLEAMSRAALKHAREYFTWDRVADDVVRLCDEIRHAPIALSASLGKKVGVLSTWNQECGIATYANYLFSQFEPGSYRVFAEKLSGASGVADQNFVERCWRREVGSFTDLEHAVQRAGIELLHLNLHSYDFFSDPGFAASVERMRARGVQIVTHLHTTFTLTPRFKDLVKASDALIVLTRENKLQAVANGADPEKVWVLPHGVHRHPPLTEVQRQDFRRRLGIPLDAKLLVSFGFVQPNKGMEGVVEAIAHLRNRGIRAFGYIGGKPTEGHPHSHEYFRQLQDYAQRLDVKSQIIFASRFLSDTEVRECIGSADVVFMNYHSQYYESSGACAIAVGMEAVVATSLAPNFAVFQDAVWHITSGFPAGVTAEVLITDSRVRETLKMNARRYGQEHAWDRIAQKLHGIYREMLAGTKSVSKPAAVASTTVEQVAAPAAVYDLAGGTVESQELVERGELATKNGSYAEAEGILKQAAALNPGSARCWKAWGTLRLIERDFVRAKDYFIRAQRLDAKDAKILCGLAMSEMGLQSYDLAYEALRQALSLDPYNLLAIKQLVECSYLLNRYTDLEQILKGYTERFTEDLEMRFCLAGCRYKLGNIEAARQMIEQILSVNPAHRASLDLKERLAKEEQERESRLHHAAAEREDHALDLRIAEVEDLKHRREYARLKEEAEKLLAEGKLVGAREERVRLLHAEALALTGVIDESEKSFREVLAKNPLSARALCGIGALAANRLEWDVAQGHFEKAASLDTASDVALGGLGICAAARKENEKALEFYLRALKKNPENLRSVYGVLELGYASRNFGPAEKALADYLELHPLDLNMVYALAGCYYAQERLEEARSQIQKIKAFEPQHAKANELEQLIADKSTAGISIR